MHRTSRLTLAILGFCLGSGVAGDMISPGYIPETPDSVVASGSLSNQPVNVMQTSQYAQLTVGFWSCRANFSSKVVILLPYAICDCGTFQIRVATAEFCHAY